MRIRRLGAVLLAVPVAVGVMVLGLTSPAQAATGITAPGTETITEGSTVKVSAQADNVLNAVLQIAAPGSDEFETIASGGNLLGTTHLSKTVGIARNGVYKVRLRGGLTGATYDSRSFTVRVPPATPDGLRTSAAGGKVVVRWKRGLESELTGYQIAATGTTARTRSVRDICADTECRTTITLPAGTSGRIPVFVKALRSDGAGGTVGSKIARSTVDLAGGPLPAGVPAERPGLPGVAPDIPLSPLQTNAPLGLPAVTPDGAAPGFQYPAPVPEVAAPAQPVSAPGNAAVTPYQWGKSLASALILLLIAGHLSTWTRRVRVAEARNAAAGGRTDDADDRRTPAEESAGESASDPADPVKSVEADSVPKAGSRPVKSVLNGSARKPGAAPADAPPPAPAASSLPSPSERWAARRSAMADRPSSGHRGAPSQRPVNSGYRGRRRAD